MSANGSVQHQPCGHGVIGLQRKVEVKQLFGDFPSSERETALSFIADEHHAEVTTADYPWQKRLESLGCRPFSITTFARSAGEIRYYDLVPRRYIRMPSAGRVRREGD